MKQEQLQEITDQTPGVMFYKDGQAFTFEEGNDRPVKLSKGAELLMKTQTADGKQQIVEM